MAKLLNKNLNLGDINQLGPDPGENFLALFIAALPMRQNDNPGGRIDRLR